MLCFFFIELNNVFALSIILDAMGRLLLFIVEVSHEDDKKEVCKSIAIVVSGADLSTLKFMCGCVYPARLTDPSLET